MKKQILTFQNLMRFKRHGFGFTYSLFLAVFMISFTVSAQGPGSPYVDAGEDISLDCGEDCVELTADFLDTGETTRYVTSSIPYDTPYPFSDLQNRVSVNIDDRWSNVINLPFDFCFFDNSYSEIIIGSNGIISFDTGPAGQHCSYVLGEREVLPIPSVHKNAIMLYHDIDPAYGNNQIGWELFGDAPNRALVVSFYNVPYYSSSNRNNTATSTFQMVMYETTNAIDFFVQSKPDPHNHVSSPINGGRAVLGIQNATGTQGYTPPGRNTSVWSATEEAWRFTPSGESNVTFEWLNAAGDVIGTEKTVTVCPSEQSSTYTAQATWLNCNGDTITVSDDVTVTRDNVFDIDLGGDQEFCGISSYDITATILDGNANDATFLWSTGETTQTITVTETGTYSVEVTLNSCEVTDSVHIILNESPDIDLGEDMNTCFEDPVILDATPSNYSDSSIFEFTWMRNGTLISGETASTLTVTEPGRYSVTVSYLECEATDTINIGLISMELDLGEDFETCFADPVVLNANPNNDFPDTAEYVWALDGDVIQGADESSLSIDEEGTYSVTVTVGSCSVSDSINIIHGDDPIVSLGPDQVLCPGEKHTITATTDAEGAVFRWFRNDEEILGANGSTLEIDLEAGTATTTYSVEVGNGQCIGTDSVDISLYALGSCIISQGISPNGDGLNDSLDLTFLNDRTGIKKLQIFNRLGTLVFEKNDYTNQWEGQSNNGNELPTGTYFYVIDLDGEDSVYGQQATGWIYLNRKP